MASDGLGYQAIRLQGALMTADALKRIASLQDLHPKDYGLEGIRINEAVSRAWNDLQPAWRRFAESPQDASATRQWHDQLLRQLGYGRLTQARASQMIDGREFPITYLYQNAPIHLLPAAVRLDVRNPGVTGAARLAPHSLVQQYLNASEAALWGIVGNGLEWRLLRDNVSLSRPAMIQFDLQAIFTDQLYSEFLLFWLMCHESSLYTDDPEHPERCRLEVWAQQAAEGGKRALDVLRDGVQACIEHLGQGFLRWPGNNALRQALYTGQLSTEAFYRQLLRLNYRLLFLCVAEDRELIPVGDDAEAAQRYREHYALRRLRQLALLPQRVSARYDDLYRQLTLVFGWLGTVGRPELGLHPLGGLFDPDGCPDLDAATLDNRSLLEALRALTTTREGGRLVRVDFRNLASEEMGSVYEALLELHPRLDLTTKTFALQTDAGNERKTTGSYYTPDELIQSLLDTALNPVIDARLQEASSLYNRWVRRPDAPPDLPEWLLRTAPEKALRTPPQREQLQEWALLSIRVCDPACGSGHFLIAAAHRLAERLAEARTAADEPSAGEHQRALRDVIGRCLFGVDINPMAVELCKVALWMEAMTPGCALSFLDHHIQCGNSLLGATPELIDQGLPDKAFTPLEGDDKTRCTSFKKQNRAEREGQTSIFDYDSGVILLGDLARSVQHQLETASDGSLQTEHERQRLWERLTHGADYMSGRLLADAWVAAFLRRKDKQHDYPITTGLLQRIAKHPYDCPDWLRAEIRQLAAEYRVFHWHLAFPQVFNPASPSPGFDAVLGNPPWEILELKEQEFFTVLC